MRSDLPPNADCVRHIQINLNFYSSMMPDALKAASEDGFALLRVVPVTAYECVAVFERVSHRSAMTRNADTRGHPDEVCDYIPTPEDRGLVERQEGEGCPSCRDIDLASDEKYVCEDCETVWVGAGYPASHNDRSEA